LLCFIGQILLVVLAGHDIEFVAAFAVEQMMIV
jgi:hypothetical protein